MVDRDELSDDNDAAARAPLQESDPLQHVIVWDLLRTTAVFLLIATAIVLVVNLLL